MKRRGLLTNAMSKKLSRKKVLIELMMEHASASRVSPNTMWARTVLERKKQKIPGVQCERGKIAEGRRGKEG
jgi:hypothetical protein